MNDGMGGNYVSGMRPVVGQRRTERTTGPDGTAFYRIVETVTPDGHTIEWPECFATRDAAQKYADKH